ncbi:MAG: nucleotidyltransferase domain-containing protein [Candidatus Sumerlaeota bacterium]|nr:nucleotidyltransferase domain-containing protein [Candidatus Sumerlaeota bacterium]
MKTLDPNLLSEITHRLTDEFQPEAIFLFGSHVWGVPTEDSDLDLLVVVPDSDEEPPLRARRAYRCLRGISAPKDIIVNTLAETERQRSVPASLMRRIWLEGRRLYERR